MKQLLALWVLVSLAWVVVRWLCAPRCPHVACRARCGIIDQTVENGLLYGRVRCRRGHEWWEPLGLDPLRR